MPQQQAAGVKCAQVIAGFVPNAKTAERKNKNMLAAAQSWIMRALRLVNAWVICEFRLATARLRSRLFDVKPFFGSQISLCILFCLFVCLFAEGIGVHFVGPAGLHQAGKLSS